MKKIITLCTTMLLAIAASAQVDENFQFVDAQGNVVADGSTIVVKQLNEEGQMVIPLWVKNISGEKVAVSMYETLDNLPNGGWQTCAFGNCKQLSQSGYSSKNIMAADYEANIETEWKPDSGSYATWEATLQIHVFNITKVSRFGVVTETAGEEIIGYGPTVTVRFEYKETQDSQSTSAWWGYTSENDKTSLLGVKAKETYDCAIFVPATHDIAKGKTIKSIRFKLTSTNVSNLKVWISEGSLPENISNATIIEEVASPAKGVNEVKLSTPYTIGAKGVYVGYSFAITALSDQADSYPIHVVEQYTENSFWLRTTSKIDKWEDESGRYGSLLMQMLLEGDFYDNAISINSTNIGDYTAVLGKQATVYLPVTNLGTNPITSIEYSISTNGKPGDRGSLGLSSSPIVFGEKRTLTLDVESDQDAGSTTKVITINKVNGKEPENGSAQAQFSYVTVSKIVSRAIAVEEFTGTQCGYCPRGIAGLEKLNKKYGDKVVITAVHGYANGTNEDAMYLSNWWLRYADIFSGSAPACQLNRAYGQIDPYYGLNNDICDDVDRELAIPARVGITLKGEWNADSTQVTATADLEAVADGLSYTIEYALVADGLTGTSSAWNQSNYYYTSTSSDPDIAPFCRGGEHGQSVLKGWTFNDAVIATCYINGKNQTTAPGKLDMGKSVTNSYTLTMPNDKSQADLIKAIDKSKVAVVAFVIGADGTVANAAKCHMNAAPKGDVNGDNVVDVADITAVIAVMAASANDPKADINGDGIVDVADISAVISIMAAK